MKKFIFAFVICILSFLTTTATTDARSMDIETEYKELKQANSINAVFVKATKEVESIGTENPKSMGKNSVSKDINVDAVESIKRVNTFYRNLLVPWRTKIIDFDNLATIQITGNTSGGLSRMSNVNSITYKV